jgi:hypothetical protein
MYEHIWDNKVLTERFYGHVDLEEAIKSSIRIQKNPHYKLIRCRVIDLIDSETISITQECLEKIANATCRTAIPNTSLSVAVITNSENLILNIVDYIKSFSNNHPIYIFNSRDDALKFITYITRTYHGTTS